MQITEWGGSRIIYVAYTSLSALISTIDCGGWDYCVIYSIPVHLTTHKIKQFSFRLMAVSHGYNMEVLKLMLVIEASSIGGTGSKLMTFSRSRRNVLLASVYASRRRFLFQRDLGWNGIG